MTLGRYGRLVGYTDKCGQRINLGLLYYKSNLGKVKWLTSHRKPNGQSLTWMLKSEATENICTSPPSRWDASPSQGYPPAACHWYPFIHLGGERQRGVKFFFSEKTGQWAGTGPSPVR